MRSRCRALFEGVSHNPEYRVLEKKIGIQRGGEGWSGYQYAPGRGKKEIEGVEAGSSPQVSYQVISVDAVQTTNQFRLLAALQICHTGYLGIARDKTEILILGGQDNIIEFELGV